MNTLKNLALIVASPWCIARIALKLVESRNENVTNDPIFAWTEKHRIRQKFFSVVAYTTTPLWMAILVLRIAWDVADMIHRAVNSSYSKLINKDGGTVDTV